MQPVAHKKEQETEFIPTVCTLKGRHPYTQASSLEVQARFLKKASLCTLKITTTSSGLRFYFTYRCILVVTDSMFSACSLHTAC